MHICAYEFSAFHFLNLNQKPVGDEELYEIINDTLIPCYECSEELEFSNPMEKIISFSALNGLLVTQI